MFLTDDPTAVSSLPTPGAAGTPGYFTDGNPGSGIPATILRADFMNMIALELENIVLAAGLTPSKTTFNQVLQALPAALASRPEMANSLGSTGYQKFPGGLIFQWGKNSTVAAQVTFTFPIAFPNSLLGVLVTADRLGSVGGVITLDDGVAFSTTQAAVRKTNTNDSFLYLAWGY